MVTAKRINVEAKMYSTTWDLWASVFAAIMGLFGLALFMTKPSVSINGTVITLTHGMFIFGLLTGAMFWALVEEVTRPRRNFVDLLVRFFGSMIIGGFIGAFIAYYFDWPQYVEVAAFAGNPAAMFLLIVTFIAFVAFLVVAAYMHNKTFIKHELMNSGQNR